MMKIHWITFLSNAVKTGPLQSTETQIFFLIPVKAHMFAYLTVLKNRQNDR